MSVTVTSMAALETAINSPPGDRLILIDGSFGPFAGGTRTFNPQGSEAAPIRVRPVGQRGSVTINSPVWTLANGSRRLVLWDLFFNSADIALNGANHRITRCRFRQIDRRVVELGSATSFRFDHCDFSGWVPGVSNYLVYMPTGNVGNGSIKGVLFDYNYIHDGTTERGPIGSTGSASGSHADAGYIMDHCLMRNINVEMKPMVIKHSGYTIRFCTFENLTGNIQQRQGGGCEFRSNWIDTGVAAPLRIPDSFQAGNDSGAGRALVIGNRVVGDLWISAGSTPQADGPFSAGEYYRCRGGRFIGNIVTGDIIVGAPVPGRPVGGQHPALNNNLWNNTGNVVFDIQSGTTFNQESEPYVPAVRLTPSDVGLAAPDPLCPSGPQS